MAQIVENGFTNHLRLSIWTVGLQASSFGDGDFWRCPVDCSGRRIDHPRTIELVHDLQQPDRRPDVISIICDWNLC